MTPTPRRASNDPSKKAAPAGTIDRDKFPNLAAEQDWDRAQHIKQAMEAGMSRKQAEKHADDELREG